MSSSGFVYAIDLNIGMTVDLNGRIARIINIVRDNEFTTVNYEVTYCNNAYVEIISLEK